MRISFRKKTWNNRNFALAAAAVSLVGVRPDASAGQATLSTTNGTLAVSAVGAQVTSWRPAALGGDEVFFMQQSPQWGKEVHGGVPICWPWFGGRAGSPSHGLVRYMTWREEETDGGLSFVCESSLETKAIWPHDFRLVAKISMPEPNILEITVTETNTGDTAFDSAFGLHPYFSVSNAPSATLDGAPVPFPDGSTLKFAADGMPHVLGDPERDVGIEVSMADADIWRLWNPGEPNRYVAAGEWRRFLCLEPTRETPSPLAPGASRTRIVRFSAKSFADSMPASCF